jgi:hypothetical protein
VFILGLCNGCLHGSQQWIEEDVKVATTYFKESLEQFLKELTNRWF